MRVLPAPVCLRRRWRSAAAVLIPPDMALSGTVTSYDRSHDRSHNDVRSHEMKHILDGLHIHLDNLNYFRKVVMPYCVVFGMHGVRMFYVSNSSQQEGICRV